MTPFTRRVLTVVRAIPPGRVATYGDVAALAGRPGAARAVGTVMRRCGDPAVPCHRVVAAGGALGGFGANPLVKRQLLAAEGIRLAGRRIRQFARVRWLGRRRAVPAGPGPVRTGRAASREPPAAAARIREGTQPAATNGKAPSV